MKPQQVLGIEKLVTKRLILMPYTTQICENLLHDNYTDLAKIGLKAGKGWPDADVIETLPKIINNLAQVKAPTGFESWMIIKKDTLEIIGDAGFKGFNQEQENADIGYGIIAAERRQGYAIEAVEALVNWAFSDKKTKEITAKCLPDNLSSVGLLQKLNFSLIKQDDEMIYWSLTP